ncbi:type IX secretion system sortase PorU [Ekhidna sp.]|uniref:type IX secretion system sortase PorU n=1 Tax=Ekhidna sp. TaxID=2608089 RepID=UPI003B514872
MKEKILLIVCILSFHIGWGQTSILSSGSWYKVGITTTGIYKIDRNTLDALGVSDQIDPRKIKIFGNGVKGVLPQENSVIRPSDLIENSIFVSGDSDGSFDQTDYLLFYGLSPDKEIWTKEGFLYEKNFYSDTSYYFINVDGSEGKRISSRASLEGSPVTTVTTFDDFVVYEEDLNNLISSGRGWYGEMLSSGESKSFSHRFDGITSDIELILSGVSQSSEGGTFNIAVSGNSIGALPIASIPDGPGTTYSIKARQETDSFNIPATNQFMLDIAFDGNASGERGYIDYYSMTFQRSLQLYNTETSFRWARNQGDLLRYEIANAIGSNIWNVTDPTNVVSQDIAVENSKIIFQSQSVGIEEYIVFEGSEFPTPFVFGSVSNQNLRGNTNYDGIIVTNPKFLSAAEQLAQFHSEFDGLNIKVATTTQVYNEFSSGRQDVSAIRDFAKHVYDNGRSLKYLLLLGDCSYDYKDRITNNTNYVPTYESRQSFHPIFSYSSDDYFGFFESDEGYWEETQSGDHTMEIGVGRLPAKSISEANAMVNKIIYYSTSPNTLGKWRNEITFVADDGDGNIHSRHVEDLSELIDTTYAQYHINKVLLDAFTQEGTGSSEESPQARSALKTRIKNGTFSVNFIGHGNERLWMEEEIFTKADIEEMTNRDKLPIFVTATCEFGRHDDPISVSGAEELLLLERGGGIALLTTSRPVFASTNFSLNQAFHENVFRKEQNQNLRLGDVIRLTKNEGLEGAVNRNFTLLGDPMMMPSYPKLDIKLNNSPDTLSALEEITITGQIENGGILKNDFNGTLFVSILDEEQSFKTLGQESAPYTYSLRSNAIFRGEATVSEGTFTFSFIVPKNISYQNLKGKMSLYAWDQKNNIDAGGSSRNFIIGGTNPNPVGDENPPVIKAYLNDSTFINGDLVGNSPLLIAKIEDESGVTTTSAGVVQGITLTLGEEVFNLNDFYISDKDDFKKGSIVYPLQDLSAGRYVATIRVWDAYNNASETDIEFVVTEEPTLFVYNAVAYPNPVKGSTTFSFEHDREEEDIEITFVVFSTKGEVVNKQRFVFENSSRNIEIPWNAQTNSGKSLIKGIYFSKMIIRSRLDGATKEINQKLVIVN